jgi:hypothetical protein
MEFFKFLFMKSSVQKHGKEVKLWSTQNRLLWRKTFGKALLRQVAPQKTEVAVLTAMLVVLRQVLNKNALTAKGLCSYTPAMSFGGLAAKGRFQALVWERPVLFF